MRVLSAKNGYIKNLIDEQKINTNIKHRPFKYISTVEVDDGMILLNNLTDESIFLDSKENQTFLQLTDFTNETLQYLVKNYFLVPEDFDDLTFSKNVEDTISLIYRSYRKRPIDSFTIFPTTDCNARCFYCYQHGCEFITMSQETAEDVADYILKNKADKELLLRWFGGEPLYNSIAIDIITEKLIENGIPFKSIMTTNGYLFDSDMIEKAKNKWNLTRVQITLDGTEEIYNKVKAYIYADGTSAYKRVIDNIEKLLQNDIIVNVRMNMDEHNVKDLFILTDEILKRYKKYDNFYAYVHLLYSNSCDEMKNRSEEKEEYLRTKCDELLAIIRAEGKNKTRNFEDYTFLNVVNHCMADTDSSVMILPDGKLGKCEHYLEDHHIGTIHDDKIDLDNINWFKTLTTICAKCDDCELRSRCRTLKYCHSTRKKCSETEKRRIKDSISNKLIELYQHKKDEV